MTDKKICPRCESEYTGAPALSRTEKEYICPDCGTIESLEGAFSGIPFVGQPNLEDLKNHSHKMFKGRWKTAFTPSMELKEFNSGEIEEEFRIHPAFAKNVPYTLGAFSEVATNIRVDENLPHDEVNKWDRKGGLCIYLSVLLYWLLRENGIPEKDVKLCQGFYKHNLRKDFPEMLIGGPFGRIQTGIHSWITYQGNIIDVTIGQQESVFDFEGSPYVMGEIPEGLHYYGWEEPEQIAKDYARMIARENGQNFFKWIEEHNMKSYRYIDKTMQEMIAELNKELAIL
jgi:hypothetical protein